MKELFGHLEQTPDLVIVACNPEAHLEYASFCISQGINVLIDKPINVVANASSDLLSARQIYKDFSKLLALQQRVQEPHLAVTLLRRRTLKPFRHIIREVADCYQRTRQGITQINIIVNGGIHKFPSEFFSTPGAHGYLMGVGSLSHSAYHYIDVVTWLLQSAPGDVRYLRVSLACVKRIADYIKTGGYSALQQLLDLPDTLIQSPEPIPQTILDAELDSSFTIEMLDSNQAVIGHINFVFCHTTFTSRTRTIEVGDDHANYPNGGRMSHIYLDVQQGSLQSWQLEKNDIVFQGNTIRLSGRVHPYYGRPQIYSKVYEAAYENTERPLSILLEDVLSMTDNTHPTVNSNQYIKDIKSETLNMRLFSTFYELLAMNKVAGLQKTISLDVGSLLTEH